MPRYTYRIFVIQAIAGVNPPWQLSMKSTRPAPDVLSYFDTPEKAAHALGTFDTGNAMWDAMKSFADGIAADIIRDRAADLRNWQREEA